jgi:hypothetical protein
MSHRALSGPAYRLRLYPHFPLHIQTSILHLRLPTAVKSDRAARSLQLISNKLAMFNFDLRLVSFDGSPLPMTRHPGGVTAHLLSPRRLSDRPLHVSLGQNSTFPCTLKSNPPHIAAAAIRPCNIEPNVDSNPPHASHAATVLSIPMSILIPHMRRIACSDHSAASSIPHFPPVERLRLPPIYLTDLVPMGQWLVGNNLRIIWVGFSNVPAVRAFYMCA